MSPRRRSLLGQSRRQRMLRMAQAGIIICTLVLLAIWIAGGVEERPGLARWYLPAFGLLLIIWLGLVILDLREGLRDVVSRGGEDLQ